MLNIAVNIAYVAFSIAFLLAMARLLKGPDTVDRLLALDTLYVNAMALVILLGIDSIAHGRSLFFEVALLIALMGFVGTVAGARFLARGDAIE